MPTIILLLLLSVSMLADSTVHYVISTGQSLSIGSHGTPVLSVTQPPVNAGAWVSHSVNGFYPYNLKGASCGATTCSLFDFYEGTTPYRTGTVSIDTSGNVTGTGTTWTSGYSGGTLVVPSANFSGTFTFADATHGTVSPAPGVAISAATYGLGLASQPEYPILAMVNQMTELHASKDWVSAASAHGIGGTAYSGLKKGTSPYSTSISTVTKLYNSITATNATQGLPRPFVVTAVDAIHGETDHANSRGGTPDGYAAADYAGFLLEWFNDYNTDVKAITGQAADIVLVTDQMGTWTANNALTPTSLSTAGSCAGYASGKCPGVPLGQWWAARDNPTKIILAQPKYQYKYDTDGLHTKNFAYRHIGEMHAKALRAFIDNGSWKPLAPRTITQVGSTITVRFWVPAGSLAFDESRNDAAVQMFTSRTDSTTGAKTYGFEVVDGSGNSVAISSVTISSSDTVTVALNSTPTGTPRVRYAYTATAIGANQGTSTGARGNLRDTETRVGLDGLPLYDYAITFDEAAGFTWGPQGAPQITNPDLVVVRQGGTVQLTGINCPSSNCGWGLYPGHDSTSSINPITGVYTAPTTVKPLPKIGGCTVGAHNNIYNTRVDDATAGAYGVAPFANSTDQIQQLLTSGNGANYKGLHIAGGYWRPTLITNNTPYVSLIGKPSSLGSDGWRWTGSYRLATPSTSPIGSRNEALAETEGGFLHIGGDNHYIGINRDTCEILELYFPGTVAAGNLAGTAPNQYHMGAGDFYHSQDFRNAQGRLNLTYGTSIQGSAAGGIPIAPLQLSLREVMEAADRDGINGDVGHALAIQVNNFSAIAPAAAGWLWPATARAGGCGGSAGTTGCAGYQNGLAVYGTRYRLKQSFVDNYNPSLDSSDPTIQKYIMVVLNSLVRYGVHMTDGTIQSDSFTFHNRHDDLTDSKYDTALTLLRSSPNLASNWTLGGYNPDKNVLANFEAVNISALMSSPTTRSNAVLAAFAKPERAIWYDLTTSPATELGFRDISVTPRTVGTLHGQLSVISGATIPLADYVWATGLADNSAITYTIRSGSGSIGATSGVYTPPAMLTGDTPTTTVVRAAATEDANAYQDIRIVNYPPASTRLCVRLSANNDVIATPCTLWGKAADGTYLGLSNHGFYIGNNAASRADTVYPLSAYDNGPVEFATLLHIPNGRWAVTALAQSASSTPAGTVQLELNGNVAAGPVQWPSYVSGVINRGARITGYASVTDGKLTIAWRRAGASGFAYLNAIVIEPAPVSGIVSGRVSLSGRSGPQ